MDVDGRVRMGIGCWPAMAFRSRRPPQVMMAAVMAAAVMRRGGRDREDDSGVAEQLVCAALVLANANQTNTLTRARLPPRRRSNQHTHTHTHKQPAVARLLRPGDPWLQEGAGGAADVGGGGDQNQAQQQQQQHAAGRGAKEGAKQQQQQGAQQQQESGGQPAAAASATTSTTAVLHGRAAVAAAVAAGRRVLYVDFTKDPPDEFQVGARFVCGLPFPFLSIRTARLAGAVDADSGEATLEFVSEFVARRGDAPPTALEVRCDLTTEAATVLGRTVQGARLRGGRGVLVANALVPKTKSRLANWLLRLPAGAWAALPTSFAFLGAGDGARGGGGRGGVCGGGGG